MRSLPLLLLLASCQIGVGVAPTPTETRVPPSRFTVQDRSQEAFSHRFPDMDPEKRTLFFSGESLFDQSWVTAPASTEARDGLGPLFNARSCAACHFKDGRTRPFDAQGQPTEAVLVRLSQAGQPEPTYGEQLQPFAIGELAGEATLHIGWEPVAGAYGDGVAYSLQRPVFHFQGWNYGPPSSTLETSVRQSPQLIGLGLLEQIPAADILAQADPEDVNRDGISGRPNWVHSVRSGRAELGRFGWKANQPTIEQQVAAAFAGDIGITTSLFPKRHQSPVQAPFTVPYPDGGTPELPDRLLERVTLYIQNLAVPAARPASEAGAKTFQTLGCATCHRPTYQVQGATISPYTDLLLHDMGPELADQRPDGEANGQEWRTPPLWGVGLIPTVNGHSRYLHDGRARNLTEAVLWHGGEAAAARDRFKALPVQSRDHLITFLESL
jgi:CxxC motif-containing protein (DUF1111 family)